jgi:hypothetical protein
MSVAGLDLAGVETRPKGFCILSARKSDSMDDIESFFCRKCGNCFEIRREEN